ncbi:hypothetical protein [Streptomyces hundungensis]|uniref:hypothetical protein n=1 Tax=Streptomyces hundungensis TaxID=1077946 RepID=UPI003F570D9A
MRRRSRLARPNICRFSIFNRLMLPSTAPELWGRDSPVADGVEVAAEVAGEARQWDEGVAFDLGYPVLEVVAVACGHHDGELPDMPGEPVHLGIAFTQQTELDAVLVPQVIGVSHDP